MFKQFCIYRIEHPWQPKRASLEEALSAHRFQACSPNQERSIGWAPPRGDDHDALAEWQHGQIWLRLKTESKLLPASVVNRHAEEQALRMQAAAGRKLAKRSRQELREDALRELLPRAFTRLDSKRIWIDLERERVVLETTSPKAADEMSSFLLDSFKGLRISLLSTQRSPAAVMAAWLTSFELPPSFELDRECELKAMDETQAMVRYCRHNLEIEEVRRHIQHGKMPRQLGLSWRGRLAFVLTETLAIKRLKFTEAIADEESPSDEDHFDANCALTAGELGPMLDDLVAAFGGPIEA